MIFSNLIPEKRFEKLGGDMGTTFFFDWEIRLMEWLQKGMGAFGTFLSSALTEVGDTIIMAAVLSFIYLAWDKKFGRYLAVNLMLALTWNPLIKNIFFRRRPYFDNPSIKCLKLVESGADPFDIVAQGYSFPSGHSTSAVALYTGIAYKTRYKWARILCYILPILVGLSRVCLGCHYPTDVLLGWVLGILTIVASIELQKVIKKKWLFYLVLFVTAVPGVFYCQTADYYTGLGMMIGFFAADLFDDCYTHFEETRSPLKIVLRILGAGAIFLASNAVLKLPFSSTFLDSGTKLALIVRMIRYAIVAFLTLGLFPVCFKFFDKKFEKSGSAK